MGRLFHPSVSDETGIQKLTAEVASESHVEDSNALLLPHLVLPQRTIMGATRTGATTSNCPRSSTRAPPPNYFVVMPPEVQDLPIYAMPRLPSL
jgi:hypothetical protein